MSVLQRFVIFLIMIVWVSDCKKSNFFLEVSDTEGEPQEVDIVIKKFTAEGYKEERANWHLEAAVSYVSYATSQIFMKDLLITYYEGPNQTAIVNSDTGTMNRDTNDLLLEGHVFVNSSNGRRLFTEKLLWLSQKEELTSDVPVKIVYPNGEVINGTGMKSNGSLSNIVIFQPVGVHPPDHE